MRRQLLLSAAPLALALAAGSQALAQSVVVGGQVLPGGATTPDWVVGMDLVVGDTAPATLSITGGGTVTNDTAFVGDDGGGQGAVTVSGQDAGGDPSTWTNNGDVVIGQSGSGTLAVDAGGLVTSQTGYIGAGPGGDGSVTVEGRGADGDASTWANSGDLWVGADGVGDLTIRDGGLVTNGNASIAGGGPGLSTVTVSGRAATGEASTWTNSGTVYVGYLSAGSLRVEGGALMTSGQGLIGGNIGTPGQGTGDVTVTGTDGAGHASTWNSQNLYVGAYNDGSLDIEDGGVVNTTGAGYVGHDATGVGTVTVSSGGPHTSAWNVSAELYVGEDGNGTVTLDAGGLVTAGTSVFIAHDAAATGALNLPGGVLETTRVARGAGAATLNLDGGTLRARSDVADFLDGFTALAIGGGGVTFDTNGHDIGIATDFTGASSLDKRGAGTLTLEGDSSGFTGDATVTAGGLRVGNAGAAELGGDVEVASGARLAGIGTIGGDVDVAGGGVLAPGGSAAPGTLTIDGNLTLAGASVLNYRLGQAGTVGGGLNDLVVVGGALTLDGTLNVTTAPGGTYGPGVYRLITYTGALTDNGLALGTLPASGTNAIQVSIGGQVNLVNTASGGGGGGGGGTSDPPTPPPPPPPPPLPPLPFWDGPDGTAGDGAIHGGDGTWRVDGPPVWTETSGATNGGFSNGVFAIFAARPGVVTVDGGPGAVAVSGMQFASDGYRLAGDPVTLQAGEAIIRVGDGTAAGARFTATIAADLTGPGTLAKTDLGTLVLAGTNSFTGGARISSGALQVDGRIGGPLEVASGGRLTGAGQVGSTANHGIIAPGRGGLGTLTIAGDYAGLGGGLEIEAELGGDGSPADRLVVTGATSGDTAVKVTNLGGQGAATAKGILVVRVEGASDGRFTLAQGDYSLDGRPVLVAGAYGYVLDQDAGDGDWYLRSGDDTGRPLYQPGAPVYEAHAETLLAMNEVPTLRQRVGDAGGDGLWGRVEGRSSHLEAPVSATGVRQDTDAWQVQFGAGRVLAGEADGARLVGGLTVRLGAADTRLGSAHGGGRAEIKARGLGATLTWYGGRGAYLDAQAEATWFESDLDSSLAGRLADGLDGRGYGLGLEAGKAVKVGGLSVTPQAQLTYARAEFDGFTDPFGARVEGRRGESLRGRMGLSVDHARSWRDRELSVYGLANARREFLDGSRVRVSGTALDSRQDRTWGGVAVGGRYSWGDGRYAIHGEAVAETGLKRFGASHAVGATAGFRMRF